MKRVAVYCGSASPADPVYIEAARHVGRTLAERGIGLVYGGGKLGLMGAVADSALEAFEGGVIPASSQFGPRLRELLAKGTPVKVAPLLELQSIDHKDIDAHRFDLPGPVVTAEELLEPIPTHAEPVGPLQPLP